MLSTGTSLTKAALTLLTLTFFTIALQAQFTWKVSCTTCDPGDVVKTDSRNNVYVLSNTAVSKISPAGTTLWKADITFPSYNYTQGSSLMIDDRDKVYVAGLTFNQNDSAKVFVMSLDTSDGHITKICKNDTMNSYALYGGTANASYYNVGLYQDVNRNLNLLFAIMPPNGWANGYLFAAMQVNDNLDIQKVFESQEQAAVAEITGYAEKNGSVYYGMNSALGKVNSAFTANSWTYQMDSSQTVSVIRGDNAGALYVIYNTYSGDGFSITKISDMGASAQKVWRHSYTHGNTNAEDLKLISGSNSIYVAGTYDTYENSSVDYIYYAAKIDLGTQAPVWEHFDSVNKRILFRNMAIDANNQLAVISISARPGHKADYCYIKYDATGSPTYFYYDGACAENDGGNDITVNHNNQVIITGSACENSGVNISTTLLYANGTGTGINEPDNTALNIYPNPATDKLKIAFTNQQPVKAISVTNLQGQQALMVSNPSTEIDISSLAPGVYILSIELQEGGVIYRKVAKE